MLADLWFNETYLMQIFLFLSENIDNFTYFFFLRNYYNNNNYFF